MNERNYDPAGCRRLLAAVVFLAVKDTVSKPVCKKGTKGLTIAGKADSAFEFLFGVDEEISELYLELLGWEPEVFKNALLGVMNKTSAFEQKALFSGSDKRIFRYNYANWMRRRQFLSGDQDFNFDELEEENEC